MPIDFTGTNKWRRVFFQTRQGNPANRSIGAPLVEPFEVPLTFNRHIIAVSVICQLAKPKWRTSGYLKQVYSGVNLEEVGGIYTANSPAFGVDVASQRIGLNVLEMIRFPKLSEQFYLWFDPVSWLPSLTIAIWEFQGVDTIPTLEYLGGLLLDTNADVQTIDLDLDRIEEKLDTNYGQ